MFVIWYVLTKGGVPHLLEQVHRLGGMTGGPKSTVIEAVWQWIRNLLIFCFDDRIFSATGQWLIDVWPALAALGIAFFPVARFRKWIALWVLALMSVVFRKQDNVTVFFYPATLFLPLLALGVAGALASAGELVGRKVKPAVLIIPLGVLTAFGLTSLRGSLDHFRTKIDYFTQVSVREADDAMALVNANTTAEDFVLVPKQIYWLAHSTEKKSMLSHCVTIGGGTNDAWPVPIPREFFWFDCHWQNAKYLVLASGVTQNGQPRGIDLIYTRSLAGVQEVIDAVVLRERWPVVFTGGHQVAVVPVGPGKQWPVVVDGEYMVLANPRFVKTNQNKELNKVK
jgi:hypothetical protein